MAKKRATKKPVTEYRYSERGVIRAGDVFKARGGPRYKDQRVGYPGRYKMLGREDFQGKVHLVACPVDKHWLPTGGTVLLYVEGPVYSLDGLPDWVIRPYKVYKLRRKK